MAVVQPRNKLNLLDITNEPSVEDEEDEDASTINDAFLSNNGAAVNNIDHNVENAPEPEVQEEWKCTDSGNANAIACGEEDPPVDVGLLIDLGTTIIKETGLDDEIKKLLGLDSGDEEDAEVTCTQTIDENQLRTTTCSNGMSKSEQC